MSTLATDPIAELNDLAEKRVVEQGELLRYGPSDRRLRKQHTCPTPHNDFPVGSRWRCTNCNTKWHMTSYEGKKSWELEWRYEPWVYLPTYLALVLIVPAVLLHLGILSVHPAFIVVPLFFTAIASAIMNGLYFFTGDK